MGFFLFLLVNATLFVRPMEIIAELEGVKFYEFFILGSLVLSLPEILSFFAARPLRDQPITLSIFGLFCVNLLPHLTSPGELARQFEYFAKVLVYYVLAVSVLNTPTRMRIFLGWLLICFICLTTLTVLQYHEVIDLSPPKPERNKLTEFTTDAETGKVIAFGRLMGTGSFADPNEFCAILAVAVPLCCWALSGRHALLKPLWLGLLVLSLYGIALTKSRGGFLGLLAGLGAMCYARFGLKKTIILGCSGLPVLLLAFGGRQTEISASAGTGQTRVQLWSEWLTRFREAPLTGGGLRMDSEEDRTLGKTSAADLGGHLAHNSYLQAFADWGCLGGALFLGAFCFAIWGVGRYGAGEALILHPQLRRLQPYLFGAIAAYAVGILSLSMTERVPTYFMLALGCVFPLMTRSVPPLAPPRFTPRVIGCLVLLSAGFLVFVYVFVRAFAAF